MQRVLVPVFIATAAVLLLVAWLRPRSQPTALPPAADGRVLGRLPMDYRASTAAIAEDGADYAFVIQTSDGCHVVHRTQQGPAYAECSRPAFAPQSQRVFYWALQSESWYTRLFNWVRHLGAAPENLPVLVAGDRVVASGFALPAPVTFDATGTRWAVAGRAPARHEGGKTVPGAALMLADGQVLGRYNDASPPAFSQDGKHLAYLVDDGQVKLIVDGSEERSFVHPADALPEITQADSATGLTQQLRVAYLFDGTLMAVAPGTGGWAVYRDRRELASYKYNMALPEAGVSVNMAGALGSATAVVARSLTIAAKAPVAAWWERLPGSEDRWHVVRDGRPDGVACARFWKNYPPVLSADGQHLAYPCYLHPEVEEDDKVMVVADGKQFGPYANAWGLVFSDDGAHFAYATADGPPPNDWSYHVDGKVSPLTFEQVWQARFNATGTHIAWEAQRGKRPLLFVDGRSVGSFDEVLWGPVFSANDTVSWVVRRGRRLVRVVKTVTSRQSQVTSHKWQVTSDERQGPSGQ